MKVQNTFKRNILCFNFQEDLKLYIYIYNTWVFFFCLELSHGAFFWKEGAAWLGIFWQSPLNKNMSRTWSLRAGELEFVTLGRTGLLGFQPGGDCWCLWLQSQPQIWGLISWARKPRSISVCISGKHFLQFRSRSCSNSCLQGRKIGNGQWGCSERAMEGSFYGKHQMAILGSKSQQQCLEGWCFWCFLNTYFSQSRDIPTWTSSTSPMAL